MLCFSEIPTNLRPKELSHTKDPQERIRFVEFPISRDFRRQATPDFRVTRGRRARGRGSEPAELHRNLAGLASCSSVCRLPATLLPTIEIESELHECNFFTNIEQDEEEGEILSLKKSAFKRRVLWLGSTSEARCCHSPKGRCHLATSIREKPSSSANRVHA